MIRVGVDIGGTFTDIVALDADGNTRVRKVASTVDDYARGIVEGLAELLAEHGLAPALVAEVVHGATVASNALLEGGGARVGLITTDGFRDILEIRRLRVPRLYDLTWSKPPPLVERALRTEVVERLDAHGAVVTPLDRDSLVAAVERLLAAEVDVIAVCLLHSYANPDHEQAIAAYLAERAPGLPVCLSSEVLPEIREYERTSTTVVNAYVLPVVQRYVERLSDGLAGLGVTAPLRIMQSTGGVMGAAAAGVRPVAIIEFGPAAGVVGALALARRLGQPNIITLDIGGTTAKAALIEDSALTRASELEVGGGIIAGARLLRGGGYLVRAPAIDLAEVGAGGGSVLWLDPAGALHVGPRSAGARPGPVCYGLGGTEPTITDANVVLGYLNPRALVGGSVPLDAAAARMAVQAGVAAPLGLPLAEAAHAAHIIGADTMIRAIRAVTSERGRDPRDHVLCAFGGNGPLFAAALARALEVRHVIIPPLPGLFSAVGLLASDSEHHLARHCLAVLDEFDPAALTARYEALADEGRALLAAEGVAPGAMVLERAADLRYPGQSFELSVPAPSGVLDRAALAALAETFAREHERTYGHRAAPGSPVEIVCLRLVARGQGERPSGPAISRVDSAVVAAAVTGQREVYFGREHGWLLTPILTAREQIGPTPRTGPLIVEEYDATTVVPPEAALWRDDQGNLRLDLM